ncbi:hypothetical protein ILUMI_17331 [Ignelater luminosus]|uniref:Uncharacterized protein n=1 Tax=Ignelater luminosus TaxID=2038154 RepID=A0A8K0CP96_IGNLU|nr:hypothetical protein ILUMI_17331 [Ignelater luminosus]
MQDAKKASLESFGHEMEKRFGENQKLFYTVLKGLRNDKKVSLKKIFDKNKYLLTDDKNIVNIWREYFMDLLKTEQDAQLMEEKQKLTTDPVTKEEMRAALKKMKLGKAAGC